MSLHDGLIDQYEVAMSRKACTEEKSYTSYLLQQGLDKILKKCGEETFETVIAAKGGDIPGMIGELNDVLYHVTVLLCLWHISMTDVESALNVRCATEGKIFDDVYDIIRDRRDANEEGSYTAYLFREGLDKILKKVGEAASLLIIAAKNEESANVINEAAGLVYHLMVLMVAMDVPASALEEELARRSAKTGNLKTFHSTDVNT